MANRENLISGPSGTLALTESGDPLLQSEFKELSQKSKLGGRKPNENRKKKGDSKWKMSTLWDMQEEEPLGKRPLA